MVKFNKVTRSGRLKTWVCVLKGYRPGPGLPPKQRTIKSFGYLEDQADREAFMREVLEFNANFKQDMSLSIVQLDDVGGAIAFKKAKNTKGEIADTLQFANEDQIVLDYKLIQETFGADFYNAYPEQEVFNRFLKNISVS
ncbi:MAG: hypothetical protein LBB40_02990 [Holophagales bacterium]|jgi:hypothetical protein|nr:hypothetical protein [Holophagales bacterium]